MLRFIPCLELCEHYFHEIVQPILENTFPNLPYSAAIIGIGSEVLGYDDEMSRDHDWGPRAMIFLTDADYNLQGDSVDKELVHRLPMQYKGYRTDFRSPEEPSPRIEIMTIHELLMSFLNWDTCDDIEITDWLTFPEHKQRAITAGAVFHDEVGLQSIRDRLAYYPEDVWLYLLAAGWTRIGQEEHLMGRSGMVDDEIGSAIIGSRLSRDLMRLCFLMEKTYAPYPKWFGTAFKQLRCAQELLPILQGVQLASTWKRREKCLSEAYQYVAGMHNALNITEPLQTNVSTREFRSSRPFMVINGDKYAAAIRAEIKDAKVKRLAGRGLFGSIDQISDNSFITSDSYWRMAIRQIYELASMENPPDRGLI